MRVRLKRDYNGPCGNYAAGSVVNAHQIDEKQLQALVDADCAIEVGVVEVERAVAAVQETADVKPKGKARALGGGWYELGDGTRVRGKKAAGID